MKLPFPFSILKRKKDLYITERKQRFYSWRKPIKPYAYIRVHNEIKTIDACFKSIIDSVAGGVIGYHSCTDGTEEYILEFCRKNPQFISVKYPYDVIPANDRRYREQDKLDIETRLDTYYNFIWSKLPKKEWIIKIDADHVFSKERLEQLCRLPIFKKDCVILSRINLHCINNICYINKRHPLLELSDHWIIYNNDDIKFEFFRGFIEDEFQAWEILNFPSRFRRKIYGVLSNWHFPIVKSQRNKFNPDEWIELDKFNFKKHMKDHNMEGRITDDMVNPERILKEFEKFNIS